MAAAAFLKNNDFTKMLKIAFTYKKVYVKLAHIKNYMYLCIVIS